MRIIFYLFGIFVILFLFFIYYEDRKEKSFLKEDLENSLQELTKNFNHEKISTSLGLLKSSVQVIQGQNTTILDRIDNSSQNSIRHLRDDPRGAVKLRQ